MLDNPDKHIYFYPQLLLRIISDIYVSIVVIYHLLTDYGLSGSNNIHPMLALHKENTVFIYKRQQ